MSTVGPPLTVPAEKSTGVPSLLTEKRNPDCEQREGSNRDFRLDSLVRGVIGEVEVGTILAFVGIEDSPRRQRLFAHNRKRDIGICVAPIGRGNTYQVSHSLISTMLLERVPEG